MRTIELLQVLAGAVTGSGMTAIFLALIQRKWAKDDKRDAIVAALKVLMVDRVRYLGQCYVDQGQIALADKETLEEMYRTYKSLGGNGHLDIIMDEVEGLPLVKN